MIKLRPYQAKAVESIQAFLKTGEKHCILQAPTGSGKTVIFTYISKKVSEKSNKILILTDRIELLLQAGGSLKKIGLDAFYIQAGAKLVNKEFNCYVAMSQTFKKRINVEYWSKFLNEITLIIIDEAHKQEFNYIFSAPGVKEKPIIGFTATPKRGGKMRQLALDYQKIINTVSVIDLINKDFLVNADYYGINAPDLSGVEIDRMKGDYKENQMFKQYNTPQLYEGVLSNYKKICDNTKTLIFCVNREHCIMTALEFKKAGYKVKYIISSVSMPKYPKQVTPGTLASHNERLRLFNLYVQTFEDLSGKRRTVFDAFENNKIDILINSGIATTGYDCPDIETIILNRATTSETLLLQMLGRGSRIYPGKTHFNVLDFGDNCKRLGYYDDNREWNLWHNETKTEGVPPLKNCEKCNRLILNSYKICPFCGFKYPEKKKKVIELSLTTASKTINEMDYSELFEYWKYKGHRSAWLWRQLWYRDKEKSINEFSKKYHWSRVVTGKAINYCKLNIK